MGPRRILPAEQGQAAETQVRRFPRGQGLELINCNCRCRDARDLMFVEVRYRGNRRNADGAETVDYRKQCKLVVTALNCLQSHPAQQLIRRVSTSSPAPRTAGKISCIGYATPSASIQSAQNHREGVQT